MEATNADLDLFDLIRMLWARKWVVAGATLVCALIAVVLAVTATPIYRAEVVMVEADGGLGAASALAGQLGGIASLAGINLNSGGNAAAQGRAILESRSLVDEFIRRGKLIPLLSQRTRGLTSAWRANEYFRERVLNVQRDIRKNLTTVSIDWPDPALAAQWANGYVDLANEISRQRAIDDATRNVTYLNAQLLKTDIVELRKVIYGIIESQTKTLMLANGRVDYAYEVIDRAVAPEIRVSPQRTLIVLIGVGLGAALGCILAFALETLARHRRMTAA